MSELWFGPDGYLDLSVLADGDPDDIPPILPSDELEALHEAISASSITSTPWGRATLSTSWDQQRMGFDPDDHEHGDALAAAMGGVLDPATDTDIDLDDDPGHLDDLIDPWVTAGVSYAAARR